MDNQKREEIREQLFCFLNEQMERMICSNPRDRDGDGFIKMVIRPLLLKGELKFQIEEFTDKQAFHKNLEKEEAVACILSELENRYRNGELFSRAGTLNILISKKDMVTVKTRRKVQAGASASGSIISAENLLHNRKKRHVLEDGVYVPFLAELGVMTKDGMVVRAKYDKFRQINRFLEFIEDILPRLDRSRENVILDFGCGKSYLTFAMYYYLKELKGYQIRVIGLDLKKDVIALCNRLSASFGFEGLHFYHGDIAGYDGVERVDMVVTLHACDVATDYAIAKAVKWGAEVILSVPCCQHELNGQMECELLKPAFSYGLLKERMAALLTDAVRAGLLEEAGYQTQILEFIDMEHTPKNIMIRAVKRRKQSEKADGQELRQMMDGLHADPMLYRLLKEQGDISW